MDIYDFIKPLLFRFDSEVIHNISSDLLSLNPFHIKVKNLPKIIDGICYNNPIGLAAGFDKNGDLINHIHKLGFSFMEVGTITPYPQNGNPKPRLYRDIPNQSIINRMGFNNCGLEVIQKKLEKRNNKIVIGANIGKGFDTPLDRASVDYLKCFLGLRDLVDYFTINLSSPNTMNLRELMKSKFFTEIVDSLQSNNLQSKPIYVKISPDLGLKDLEQLIRNCEIYKINGLVVSNTLGIGVGGLSGLLIEEKSREMVNTCRNMTQMTIIGSGGLVSEEIVKSRLDNGCDLVQIYTGLIYRGPFFIKKCLDILD
jgi:dihydroorotate dehydrogenase